MNDSQGYVVDIVNNLFPEEYDYRIINFNKLSSDQSELSFRIELRVNINDKEGVLKFLNEF